MTEPTLATLLKADATTLAVSRAMTAQQKRIAELEALTQAQATAVIAARKLVADWRRLADSWSAVDVNKRTGNTYATAANVYRQCAVELETTIG